MIKKNIYEKRTSGAFRNRIDCTNNEYPNFMNAVNEYYGAIAHRLSNIEKEHFIAFAQHHGLPTNLLDVTSAPLVALFMACNGENGKGHVYIFDKDYIDIT